MVGEHDPPMSIFDACSCQEVLSADKSPAMKHVSIGPCRLMNRARATKLQNEAA